MDSNELSNTVDPPIIDEKEVKNKVDKVEGKNKNKKPEEKKDKGKEGNSQIIIKRGSQTTVVKKFKPSFFLPEADYKKLKDYCTETGKTIQETLFDCVKEWLDRLIIKD